MLMLQQLGKSGGKANVFIKAHSHTWQFKVFQRCTKEAHQNQSGGDCEANQE